MPSNLPSYTGNTNNIGSWDTTTGTAVKVKPEENNKTNFFFAGDVNYIKKDFVSTQEDAQEESLKDEVIKKIEKSNYKSVLSSTL